MVQMLCNAKGKVMATLQKFRGRPRTVQWSASGTYRRLGWAAMLLSLGFVAIGQTGVQAQLGGINIGGGGQGGGGVRVGGGGQGGGGVRVGGGTNVDANVRS